MTKAERSRGLRRHLQRAYRGTWNSPTCRCPQTTGSGRSRLARLGNACWWNWHHRRNFTCWDVLRVEGALSLRGEWRKGRELICCVGAFVAGSARSETASFRSAAYGVPTTRDDGPEASMPPRYRWCSDIRAVGCVEARLLRCSPLACASVCQGSARTSGQCQA